MRRSLARHWPGGDQRERAATRAIGPARRGLALAPPHLAVSENVSAAHCSSFSAEEGAFGGGGGGLSNKLFQRSSVLCHGRAVTRRAERRNAHIMFPPSVK